MFRGETAFCQGGADFILGVGGEILPEFFNTGRAVVAPDLLLEIADRRFSPSSQLPEREGIRPRILFKRVVFPIPLVPVMAIFWPRSMERFNGLERGSS